MKFCFIGEDRSGVNPWRIGGVESYCRRLGSGLAAEGHQVASIVKGNSQRTFSDIAKGFSVKNGNKLERIN